MPRRTVSMVTPLFAKPGAVFQPLITSRCLECPYFNACLGNLRPLVSYRVVGVRRHVVHCPALSEDLITVEVEELPARLVVNSRYVMPGAVVYYQKPGCYKEVEGCNPVFIEEGERIRILREVEKVGGELSVVEVEFIDPPHPRIWLLAKQKLLGRKTGHWSE